MALAQYQGGCHCGKVRYEVNLDLSRVLVVQLLVLRQARQPAHLHHA